MSPEYASIFASILEALGVIIAAVIGTRGARKIVQESANRRFHSYREPALELHDLFIHAQHDVFIVVAAGKHLLVDNKRELRKLLNRGIHVRYLLLSESKLREEDAFIHGEQVDVSYRSEVMHALMRLKDEYPTLFEYREWKYQMPASYVCTDIMPFPPDEPYPPSASIRIMVYLYHTHTRDCPITFLSHLTDRKEFRTTVNSIKEMWEKAGQKEEKEGNTN